MSDKYLCSILDAARSLGVGRSTIYDMIGKGDLVAIRIGARRLVKVESIEALIDRATGGAV